MTTVAIQSKRLKYSVYSETREVHKFFNKKVALAYAVLINGFIVNL
jgi:hypothetical protein